MQTKEKITLFQDSFNPIFEKEVQSILDEQQKFHSIRTSLDVPLADIILKYAEGGKRIRPFLISFFAEETLTKEVIELCLAAELFHLAALIHDDIMDESEIRRGVPTPHTAIQKYSTSNKHLGNDIALLLGDIFLTASISKAAKLSPQLFEEFRLMTQRTMRGQYLDSFGMNQELGDSSAAEILARHELKTAWYTFASPSRLGYLCSDSYSESAMSILSSITKELGLLFQIRDDIIDCIHENSGKTPFSDILEGQTTWVTLYVKNQYPEKFKEILAAKNEQNVSALQAIFQSIDLRTPYQNEFNKRVTLIEHIGEDNDLLKNKLREILNLLVLK